MDVKGISRDSVMDEAHPALPTALPPRKLLFSRGHRAALRAGAPSAMGWNHGTTRAGKPSEITEPSRTQHCQGHH